jgi:hypothetical protein
MKVGLLLALSFVFIACNGGGGSGGGGGVKVLDVTPKGFKAESPASNEAMKERFTVGCINNEPYTSTESIDSRLLVGHRFQAQVQLSKASGYQNISFIQTVAQITATSIRSNINAFDIQGVPGMPSSMNVTELCQKVLGEDGKHSWECNTVRMMNMFGQRQGLKALEEGCSVEAETMDDLTYSEVKGTYLSRTSYYATITVSGKVTCDGKDLGRGRAIVNIVWTNRAPATSIDYCGGVPLHMGSETKLENGTVLESGLIQYSSAPIVSD